MISSARLENRTFDNLLGVFMDRRYRSGEVKPSKWDVHVKAGKYPSAGGPAGLVLACLHTSSVLPYS